MAIEGFIPFLEQLVKLDFNLGVATSAPRANMDLILGDLGVESLFGSLLASEDVNQHKPNPEVYLKSADNFGVKSNTCLVFEDSSAGILAAKNAGMQVIGVLSSHTIDELPKCDHYIKTYDRNLLEIINK